MITSAKTAVETLQFEPLPKQEIFSYLTLEADYAKFIWYCGGFGSGKTYIGSQIANRLVARAPQQIIDGKLTMGRGLIARQTAVDLEATTMKTFWEITDPRSIASHNKTKHLITFKNGHEIYYWGLDDEEKLKSLELGWFWIDEVNEVDERIFTILKGRLRNKTQPKRVGFITSNSEGRNWTYQQFIKGRGIASDEQLQKYFVVKAPSNENTHLPEDYLDVLNSYTGDLHKRYVLASFDVFEGQIFPDFRREIHCVKPFAIPEEWLKIRGIDHGERNPTAILWCAVCPRGDLYFYREYEKTERFVDYHAKRMHTMGGEGEKFAYTEIDPSTKSVRGATGKKVDLEWKEEMKRYEKDFKLRYANNDVNAGIARVHRYLRVDPEVMHPATKTLGSPKIFIFDTLVKTIEEIENYKWKKIMPTSENDPEEKPRKKDDHLMDVLRYIVMSRPDISLGNAVNRFKKLADRVVPNKRDQLLTHDEKLLKQALKNNPRDFI